MKYYKEKFKELMKSQLYVFPNGRELFNKIIIYERKHLKDNQYAVPLKRCLEERNTTIQYWCDWSKTKEGHGFWSDKSLKISKLIRKRKTPWLTQSSPFIEVKE